mgnify:CR=1 FL=1
MLAIRRGWQTVQAFAAARPAWVHVSNRYGVLRMAEERERMQEGRGSCFALATCLPFFTFFCVSFSMSCAGG